MFKSFRVERDILVGNGRPEAMLLARNTWSLMPNRSLGDAWIMGCECAEMLADWSDLRATQQTSRGNPQRISPRGTLFLVGCEIADRVREHLRIEGISLSVLEAMLDLLLSGRVVPGSKMIFREDGSWVKEPPPYADENDIWSDEVSALAPLGVSEMLAAHTLWLVDRAIQLFAQGNFDESFDCLASAALTYRDAARGIDAEQYRLRHVEMQKAYASLGGKAKQANVYEPDREVLHRLLDDPRYQHLSGMKCAETVFQQGPGGGLRWTVGYETLYRWIREWRREQGQKDQR